MAKKDLEKAQDLISKVDANADGHLTKEELDAAVKSGNAEAKKVNDRLMAMFRKYDANQDGKISKSELKHIMLAINSKAKGSKNPLTEMEVEYAFMHADKNNDGWIDVPEFICWVTGTDDSGREGGVHSKVQAELGHKDKEVKGPERFFYDKSSYTGVHTHGGPSIIDDSHDISDKMRQGQANIRTQTGPSQPHASANPESPSAPRAQETESERHARLAKESAPQADAGESDWGEVSARFAAFAGKDMDGREFAKLCKDCDLFDKKFKTTDVDLVFAKVVEKGKRRIDVEQFKNALRLVAAKKECSVSKVQALVAKSSGPTLSGTKADAVKFHDDKTLYTGVHAKGGPSTIDASNNLMDQCRPGMHASISG